VHSFIFFVIVIVLHTSTAMQAGGWMYMKMLAAVD